MYATQFLVNCVAAKSLSVSPALATINDSSGEFCRALSESPCGFSAREVQRYVCRTVWDLLVLVIYHENSLQEGYNMPIDWSDCKTVLMPRQHLLKILDHSGSLNVPQLRETLRQLASDFERLVLKDVTLLGLDISQAIEIWSASCLIGLRTRFQSLSPAKSACPTVFVDAHFSLGQCSGQQFVSRRIILLLLCLSKCLSKRPACPSKVLLAEKGCESWTSSSATRR